MQTLATNRVLALFDITSGILRKVWDFKAQTIPKQAVIKKILKKVGWEKVEFESSVISFFSPTGIGIRFWRNRKRVCC